MQPHILEKIDVVCPGCRRPVPGGIAAEGLSVGEVVEESDGHILSGFLSCGNCGRDYPIVDGVPFVMRDARERLRSELAASPDPPRLPRGLAEYAQHKEHGRSPESERDLTSVFADFHYGEFARDEPSLPAWADNAAYWRTVVDAAGGGHGAALDLGCSTGRLAFELARRHDVTIGLDFRLDALRTAARSQRDGGVSYTRRLGGRRRMRVETTFEPSQSVLFIAGDALDPPFRAAAFGTVSALNLIDNVPYPLVLLGQMDALLQKGGTLVVGSPYEWRTDICAVEEWLDTDGASSAETLRSILEDGADPRCGFSYDIELDVPELGWTLRNHDRYLSHFVSHLIRARKL